jgi:dTDP-4-dehydrorhamnose reductase
VDGAFLILRTAWVYSLRRDNFVTKVLQWARQNETLRIVDDQISNPTWARALAETTALLLAKANDHTPDWLVERRGLYHLAGDGFASRLEWAKEILMLDPKKHELVTKEFSPATTADFPALADRPLFSALDCIMFTATLGLGLPGWKTSLRLAMDNI